MARKRMVSPELLTSLTVGSISVRARFAFVALWMYVDDAGRGVDNAALIKSHTWALDDYSVKHTAQDLAAMEGAGLIHRYACGGSNYLHIPAWHDWQKPQHPTPTKNCPCPIHEADVTALFHETLSSPHEPLVSPTVSLTPSLLQLSRDEGSSRDVELGREFRDSIAARRGGAA